jgi:hypothetical protein
MQSQSASSSIRDPLLAFIRSQAALERQALIEAIRAPQTRILEAAASVDDTDARHKSEPAEWSLRDLLRHVIAAEERVIEQVSALGDGRVPSPYNVLPGEEMQIDDSADTMVGLLDRIRATNAALLDSVNALPAVVDETHKSVHDFFGPMHALEWSGFQVFHDTNHATYAERLVGALKSIRPSN